MRDRLLGLGGFGVVSGATVWAVAGGPTAAIVTLVAIGLVLTAADALVWRATTSGGPGAPDLAVPNGRRAAGPSWGSLLVPAAVLGSTATVVAGSAVAAVGCGLLVVTAGIGSFRPPGKRDLPRRIVAPAQRMRAFARAHGAGHGQPVDGYLTPTGESGARLLVVAPDGAWADAMVRVGDVGVIAELARIELREPTDPVATKRLRIGVDHWARMTRSW